MMRTGFSSAGVPVCVLSHSSEVPPMARTSRKAKRKVSRKPNAALTERIAAAQATNRLPFKKSRLFPHRRPPR